MNRIKMLSDSVINHIKAGEVIERPASVVKELMENSIDAGADDILVEIRDGGKNLIKVSDNGTGIQSDDVQTAFYRHSTSKITRMEDIHNISSYGFRGEALASIAICSRCIMTTKTDEEESGTRICYDFGRLISNEKVPFNRGTAVEVSDLFQKIPARRKFLKSSYRERTQIYSIFRPLCLPFYKSSFQLISDMKEVFFYPGTDSLTGRIQEVLDIDENDIIYDVIQKEGKRISLILPKEKAASRRAQPSYIFINKRYVKVPLLMYIMKELNASSYTKNEHPFYILFLDIDPQEIDVNAHPQKLEVRCENISHIIAFIKESYKRMFSRHYYNLSFMNRSSDTGDEASSKEMQTAGAEYCTQENYIHKKGPFPVKDDDPGTGLREQGSLAESEIKVIGQAFGSYIIAEHQDAIYIIDQHAMYEEYRYEMLMENYKSQKPAMYGFLSPLVIEIGIENTEIAQRFHDMISKLGFDISIFSKKDIIVRKIPFILKNGNINMIIIELINSLKELENADIEKHISGVLSGIACHTSLRANYELTYERQKFLSSILYSIKKPKCPHNRPIFVQLDKKAIEQLFRRRQ